MSSSIHNIDTLREAAITLLREVESLASQQIVQEHIRQRQRNHCHGEPRQQGHGGAIAFLVDQNQKPRRN